MVQNFTLLKEIKDKMFKASQDFKSENPEIEFVSFYKLYYNCTKPQDWNSIAERCSTNPNHEHYGKSVESILEIWKNKNAQGQTRGNNVDDYISSLIKGKPYSIPDETDTKFINKTSSIDKFNEEILSKVFSFIGDEIWLVSKKLGIRVRCDALFELRPGEILIGEWKNIENYKTYNKYDKLLGPLEGYDNCDMFSNNLQAYLYKYILEEHGYDNIRIMIVNFEEDRHRPIKTLLDDNYKQLIESMVEYYRNENQSTDNK